MAVVYVCILSYHIIYNHKGIPLTNKPNNKKLDRWKLSEEHIFFFFIVSAGQLHHCPKWHPDRWMKDPVVAGEAKRRFQQIQEAYSVLSNKGRRTIYDAGLLGLLADDDDEEFCNFMQEMATMMESVSPQEGYTLGDLQGLLLDMMAGDQSIEFAFHWDDSRSARKKTRVR